MAGISKSNHELVESLEQNVDNIEGHLMNQFDMLQALQAQDAVEAKHAERMSSDDPVSGRDPAVLFEGRRVQLIRDNRSCETSHRTR